jgi:hypothetical protein
MSRLNRLLLEEALSKGVLPNKVVKTRVAKANMSTYVECYLDAD